MRRSAPYFIALGFVVLLGQGCFGGSSQPATGPDGGVFKTGDRGDTWAQKRVLIKGPKGVSIAEEVILSMAADPQDHMAIYAGTQGSGLLQSLDGGDSWRIANEALPKRIDAVAIDYKNKCVVYVTSNNNIYKTENCSRDWERIFFDPKTDKRFTTLAVDWFNPTIVYAGTSEGDIFKSTDAGLSWLVAQRAGADVVDIEINPKDSRHVYAGTSGDGIWQTLDGGNTWLHIEKQISAFTNARTVVELEFDDQNTDVLFAASKYGLLSSKDGGETWTDIKLINPPNEVRIVDFAINPRNGKELQYITSNSIVITSDGGISWTAKRLPSTRRATTMLVDSEDGNILYVGMGTQPK